MDRKDYIECLRFGCSKPAPACVALDRYRICRRTCQSLEVHLKLNPELVEEVKETVKDKMTKDSSKVGKNLPDETLRCKYCNTFVAKSLRGLKTHTTRTHHRKLLLKEA